ncbi:MAG: hypothetical protein CMN72_09715 [Sphingomonas sp.]|nr:hypothetical protein [Sphingomonas sp.]
MILIPAQTARRLAANAARSAADPAFDPVPLVELFNPVGAATWLASELDPDGDTLFGLADLGFGCPELGAFSLAEIAALRLSFGLAVERDLFFESDAPLSVWADTARRAGSIAAAETALAPALSRGDSNQLPPPDPGGG